MPREGACSHDWDTVVPPPAIVPPCTPVLRGVWTFHGLITFLWWPREQPELRFPHLPLCLCAPFCVCVWRTAFLLHSLMVCNFPCCKHQPSKMKNMSKTLYIFYGICFIISKKKNLSHELLKLRMPHGLKDLLRQNILQIWDSNGLIQLIEKDSFLHECNAMEIRI